MRPIDADALKEQFEETHQFYVFSWGGDFSKMPIRLKAACDELVNCIAKVVNAPTIDAVPHWIPCEEQLPNEDEIIYNGVGIDGERKLSDRVLVIDPNGFIRVGYFMKSCKPHRYNGKGAKDKYSEPLVACWEFGEHYMSDPSNWVCGCGFDAVAWMPLPKPYAERKDDE